ncbi:MAG: tetratricopeptide repeat protein [Verrucomicrobia bacterium]|nr:tetratricopeptide repeat protein [Verrucomicrobiota bacterium]
MTALEPPDSYHFSAAEGWLVLGSYPDALDELERISPTLQEHPDILLLRWHVHAKMKDWKACADVGKRLVGAAPGEISSWQNYANSLFYEKRYREAFDALFPAIEKFPKEWSVPYNLACYECQMGKLDEAMSWFKMAQALGNADEIKQQALRDPDLGPLHQTIHGL